ncbi:MAG: hypothetical protein JNK87_15095 [Bryobacterales bacterium]|nr:hypothetical protein [Bryobacterales bacterium]
MARKTAKLWLLALCCSGTAAARLEPSFYLDYCAWHATDIVVVIPAGSATQFRVAEVIAGSVAVGRVLELQGLASSVDNSRRLSHLIGDWWKPEGRFEGTPPIREGDRIIVFLKNIDQRWEPALGIGTILTSAIWIQDGELFVYEQTPPWSTNLVRYWFPEGKSEAQVCGEIDEVRKLRGALGTAVRLADPRERTRRLLDLAHSNEAAPGGSFAQYAAVEALAAGGPSEAKALLRLLREATRAWRTTCAGSHSLANSLIQSITSRHGNQLQSEAGKLGDSRRACSKPAGHPRQ